VVMKIEDPRQQINDMLRETRANLVRFSQMADTKANILLSISSVLLTFSLTKVMEPRLMLSTIVLIGFLLITIFLALLTVIPEFEIFGKKRTIHDADFNALFFGDYADVSWEDYSKHFEKILNSSDQTYELMIKEIYNAGVYLEKTKYKYIKFGYIFFFTGIIASTAIFLIRHII
jgi:hypothetical protein